jgi:predicted enzyme related to lactoylglutathione lyase
MYFDDLKVATHFFEEVLKLEKVYNPEWAAVYKVADKAFVGAVDANLGSIESNIRGGTLVSLTVDDVKPYYEALKDEELLTDISEIREFKDIGVRSFFFKGPNGYDFEIQQFTNPNIEKLFD